MGLLPARTSKVEGEVLYSGRDLLSLGTKEMAGLPGKDIAMVFQDPLTSLNPVVKIGLQLTEMLRRHLGMEQKAAPRRAIDLLAMAGSPAPARRVAAYPHQPSRGLRPRVLSAQTGREAGR